jgi:hypothetical protein
MIYLAILFTSQIMLAPSAMSGNERRLSDTFNVFFFCLSTKIAALLAICAGKRGCDGSDTAVVLQNFSSC